jgi:hypothetical protein
MQNSVRKKIESERPWFRRYPPKPRHINTHALYTPRHSSTKMSSMINMPREQLEQIRPDPTPSAAAE